MPITETEARHLRDLVNSMPEPGRTRIMARFAEASRRLEEAGLISTLRDPEGVAGEAVDRVGLAYFQLGIACPFLEDESCSIHPERPIACREFLVTSPAENCAAPSPETVTALPIEDRASDALARIDGRQGSTRQVWWVPLVLAIEWAEAHPDGAPAEPGPEIFQRFLHLLAGDAPPPTSAAPPASRRKGPRR